MLFNSLEFLTFLVLAFLIYWKLDCKRQNIFIVVVSYIFYGWWDWRFLLLIFASSVIDFFLGKKIYQTEEPKTGFASFYRFARNFHYHVKYYSTSRHKFLHFSGA
jgi:D-alanyl-lipoteichoic acid acyltransferase DltB (MBOAT superfamily)